MTGVNQRSRPLPAHRRGHVPGEPELWVFILGDLAVFGLFFGVLAWNHAADPAGYRLGQAELHDGLGLLNTLLLLTSSAAVASGLARARTGANTEARHWYLTAIGLGTGFVVVKAVEYADRIHAGVPAGADFFTYYFVFTGIHPLHVLVGLICLGVAAARCARPEPAPIRLLEGLGVYWHLVDLLWIALFALLYLI